MIFLKLFYAAIGISIGIALLKYRKTIYDWTGRFYWAEKYLWSWGTVVVIILTGLFLIGISIAYPLGAFDDLKTNPLGSTENPSNTQH